MVRERFREVRKKLYSAEGGATSSLVAFLEQHVESRLDSPVTFSKFFGALSGEVLSSVTRGSQTETKTFLKEMEKAFENT